MKLFDDTTTQGNVNGFGFSAVRPETLGSTEYTLVTLVLDKTGSVASFADKLFEVKKTVVEACRKSPRAEFLLLRTLEFNSRVDEVHGFKPLSDIDPASYAVPACGGMTALIDATYAAVSATNAYGKRSPTRTTSPTASPSSSPTAMTTTAAWRPPTSSAKSPPASRASTWSRCAPSSWA